MFDHDTGLVARALALLWTYRPLAAVHRLLPLLGYPRAGGGDFSAEDVERCLQVLVEDKSAIRLPKQEGLYRLRDDFRSRLYGELVADTDAAVLRHALYELESFRPASAAYFWPVYDRGATVAIFRLALFTGTPAAELHRLAESIGQAMHREEVIGEAALAAFDGALFQRIDPEWRHDLILAALSHLCRGWNAHHLPIADWALAQVAEEGGELAEDIRLVLAEWLVHGGDADGAEAVLKTLDNGCADALRACLRVQAGDYAGAQAAFEAASKRRQSEVPARKRVFPASVVWCYPLALLAQNTPAHLELARRFCQGEAGTQAPNPYEPWGRWVHAIEVRLGEAHLDPGVFIPVPRPNRPVGYEDFHRLLLAAWVGADTLGAGPDGDPALGRRLAEAGQTLSERLEACRLHWLAAQARAACSLLEGKAADIPFFVAGRGEAWRQVLTALQSLGSEQMDSDNPLEASRLLWSVAIAPDGGLQDIQLFEQKQGPRGWSAPRPLGFHKLVGSVRLPPWDAKVAHAVRRERGQSRRYGLDRAAALESLIGHPNVVLAADPGQTIELVEGKPEIEVVKEGGNFVLRATPPLRPGPDLLGERPTSEEPREREELRAITLIQDSPQRVRVVRLTAAQQRAARLLGESFVVPVSAREELQKTLRVLAEHFQIQADLIRAARELSPESRLRAELAPAGQDLLLRLVVAPLGPEGPRFAPGQGHPRLMTTIAGESLGTERNLTAEQEHLDAVVEALAFLGPPEERPAGHEWLVADPELALDMLEKLPALPAIEAMDWPKGQRVRVIPLDPAQLEINVSGRGNWFRLEGEAKLEEGLVLRLETLLAAARGKSRFVPIGEGIYAALTRRLKDRLAGLEAVAETDARGIRLPRLASAWVDEALEGTSTRSDQEFRGAVERLRQAQGQAVALPRNLQAELRSYQEEGYVWAVRLAAAGFGACLADDMGLGKTLQALAVLLARAAGGPALVVAPTSVCGNWRSEAERFAPSLKVEVYGEADREQALAGLGAGDVVIVSYTLFQQGQERFAGQRWHTAVADEAQAFKNAGTKRSRAVFELAADFRLALSGTPVENRLAELWSIMRFLNPGLLGSLKRFNERFVTPIEKNRDRNAQKLLRRLIGPFILRRTKAQVLPELPPRTELLLTVEADADEAAHYEALRREAADAADQVLAEAPAGQAKLNVLALLTRLRRAACDPRLTTPGFPAAGAKVQTFADLAGELAANGHKTLVFSQFVDFLTLLRRPLDQAGIPYQYLDGSTPAEERNRRVAAFQGGDGVMFLISLKAGGFGLNLTAADYVVITDPWWNPAAEDQAMGRAHRMGQLRPVTVYRMVSRGTVEERIVALHRDKRALAESVLAEGEAAALPSVEDMVALIRGS
ncbi:MAG TPA: DEAD/DEAH box helicase [Rhodocyclaceae bacterium]|nr:DEAD/DEAH box helicase [Rhodocyclaceae bacterium]